MNNIKKFINSGKANVLSDEEQDDLCQRYYKSRNILLRNKLLEHNLKLIMSVAWSLSQNPPDDIISEGCLEAVRTIDTWEPGKAKLSSLLYTNVRGVMLNWLVANSKLMRIKSTEQKKMFFNLAKARAKLEAQGKEATPEALSKILSIPIDKITAYLSNSNKKEISLDKSKSSDEGDDSGSMIDDVVGYFPSPEEAVFVKSNIERFNKSISKEQQEVFERRFIDKSTLEEVGLELHCSAENVRKIALKVKDKLEGFVDRRGL